MPNGVRLHDSRSEFDRLKRTLSCWLRANTKAVRILSGAEFRQYPAHKFIAGWEVCVHNENHLFRFHVLVDESFPYSQIRVAYKLPIPTAWPHVEDNGLLCLPAGATPAADLGAAIAGALRSAVDLVTQCGDASFRQREFEREFLSYWGRSVARDSRPVKALLDLKKEAPRRIRILQQKGSVLAAESDDQIKAWLEAQGKAVHEASTTGVFIRLPTPPVPPFIEQAGQLLKLLRESVSDDLWLDIPVSEEVVVVMSAASPTGEGLIALSVGPPKNYKGFRKGDAHNPRARKQLRARGHLQRRTVTRFDASWVHGRGRDQQQHVLEETHVLVLGCGSLGSQVAMRLAQCGVGRLTLTDPDSLATANVGRHALGIHRVGEPKAVALAEEIRLRFPHLKQVAGYPHSWCNLYATVPQLFESADLIVACMGDWSAEGQLCEWQTRKESDKPVLYGWLDEYGVAAHAVALTGRSPTLSCILGDAGEMRTPETYWKGLGLTQAEPACGTLFQPYGPLDVVHGETLVTQLCLDLISGIAATPTHRVYAACHERISQAGGEWSEEHLKYRPQNFVGPFVSERPVSPCGICRACKGVL